MNHNHKVFMIATRMHSASTTRPKMFRIKSGEVSIQPKVLSTEPLAFKKISIYWNLKKTKLGVFENSTISKILYI